MASNYFLLSRPQFPTAQNIKGEAGPREMTISLGLNLPDNQTLNPDQHWRWRGNMYWFRDSVGGDQKAAATPQAIAGDPFGIKPAFPLLLLPLLPLHRQEREPHQWLQITVSNPKIPH